MRVRPDKPSLAASFPSVRRQPQLWLMLPAVVLVVGAFVVPMALLVRMSLNESVTRPFADGLTASSYATALTEPLYLRILLRTVRLALVSTAMSLILGIPFSYLIWRAQGIRKTALLAIALVPLFTDVIARVYGWQILLSRGGPIAGVLDGLGLMSEQSRLGYSFLGAAIGLTYVALPYFVLIFVSALAAVDWRLVEAARTLGARPLRSVIEIVLPIAGLGLATATAVAFAWGMGAYAETVTLGSPEEWGLGYEAWRQWALVRNWPLSSALSILMLVVTAVVIITVNRRGLRTSRG